MSAMTPPIDPSNVSLHSIESPLDTPTKSFSLSTRKKIRAKCRHRCVICMKGLGGVGQCVHVLDACDDVGERISEFATQTGVLAPKFRRSAAENGLLLCSACHQDLFTSNLFAIAPPYQVLQYLINYVQGGNSDPIYKVLDRLLNPSDSHVGLPDPQAILPFLGLYTLVALNPKKLDSVEVVCREVGTSQLLDGRWISPPTSAPVSTIARIFDVKLRPSETDLFRILKLLPTESQENFYWRLPVGISPILSLFLDRINYVQSHDVKEIQLATHLRSLLSAHSRGGGGSGGGKKPDVPKTQKAKTRNAASMNAGVTKPGVSAHKPFVSVRGLHRASVRFPQPRVHPAHGVIQATGTLLLGAAMRLIRSL